MKKLLLGFVSLLIAADLSASASNHTSAEELLELVSKRAPSERAQAKKIIDSVYEGGYRHTAEYKYGQAFPINPEIMKELMSDIEGKTVLEIGAAGGENSILLALAGATNVIINDIAEGEINLARGNINKLPRKIQKKIIIIHANCFDLGDRVKPHSVDILYARNLFHFFKPDQHSRFFDLVKLLLKPDVGRLVMNVNHRNSIPSSQPGFKFSSPDVFCFRTQSLVVDTLLEGSQIFNQVYEECTDFHSDPTEYTSKDIVTFGVNHQHRYKLIDEVVKLVSPQLNLTLFKFIKDNKDTLSQMPGNKVRWLVNTSMRFTDKNLGNILRTNGFEVHSTSSIDCKGHTVAEEAESILFLNIIAKIPGASSPDLNVSPSGI